MEQNPNAVFYRNELEKLSPEAFQQALKNKLLRRYEANYESYSSGLNTSYLVIQDEGRFEAINEDDPEADPIPLTSSDFARYKLDLEAFARIVQQENQITGKPYPLNNRLYFLGETEKEGKLIAYILVLVNESLESQSIIMEVPALIPRNYQGIIAVYPSHLPPLAEWRRLEDLNIRATTLTGDNFVLPPFKDLFRGTLSSDFAIKDSSVTWHGQEYPITPEQKAVLQILYKTYQSGSRYLKWREIQARLESYRYHPQRMRDVFRKSPSLMKKLIIRTNKDLYSLNY
jgi:hypothetical protein